MGFADEYEQYDEEHTQESVRERGGGEYRTLPDGTHQVTITESRCAVYNDRWVFELGFDNQNGSVRKFQNLDNEIGRKIALQDADTLGWPYGTKISMLEQACEEGRFLNLVCEIRVKTKPGDTRDFTSVYINKVLGRNDQFVPAAGAPDPDDDIPF